MKQFAIAIETTGLGKNRVDEILALAVVDCATEKCLSNSLFRPQFVTEWVESEKFNHISFQDVMQKRSLIEVAPQVSAFLKQADELIAFNGPFTANFLNSAGVKYPSIVDVQGMFSEVFQGSPNFSFVNLKTMCRYYGIDSSLSTPVEKAVALAQCYKQLEQNLTLFETPGDHDL